MGGGGGDGDGGAIYVDGSATLLDSLSLSATGGHGGHGGVGGPGGSGGAGGSGGDGVAGEGVGGPSDSGPGGDGGNGGDGGAGGSGANAGNVNGGAIDARSPVTGAKLTYSQVSGAAGNPGAPGGPGGAGIGGSGGSGGGRPDQLNVAPNGNPGENGEVGMTQMNGAQGSVNGRDAAGEVKLGMAASIKTKRLPAGKRGQSYSAKLQLSNRRVAVGWYGFGLPPGLTLGSAGTLSGKPSAPGSYRVVVLASAKHGKGESAALYTLKVSK